MASQTLHESGTPEKKLIIYYITSGNGCVINKSDYNDR